MVKQMEGKHEIDERTELFTEICPNALAQKEMLVLFDVRENLKGPCCQLTILITFQTRQEDFPWVS